MTARDVAALAGVSQTTVSYVFTAPAHSRIGEATRARVFAAAETLGYKPSAIAQAMKLGRTGTVGLFEPYQARSSVSGVWSLQATLGIAEALRERNVHLLMYGIAQADSPTARFFMDGRVDGLVIIGSHRDDTLAQELASMQFAISVVAERNVDGPFAFWTDSENEAGGRMATEHLLRMGHTRIAFLRGPAGSRAAQDRRAGFESAMHDAGIPVRPEYLPEAGFWEEHGYRATQELLLTSPRPTAILATNDAAAVGAIAACEQHGISVPGDMAVIGYDDSPICTMTRPSLTSVRQPTEQMGRMAATVLVEMITSRTRPDPPYKLFPAELIVRGSCGARIA